MYAPAFGNTGMNRCRFNMLWRHVRWSHQPDLQDESTSHEAHQWKIVEDLVTHFNEYCTRYSLLRISYVLMIPYRSGTDTVVVSG